MLICGTNSEQYFVYQKFDSAGNVLENTYYLIDYSEGKPSYFIDHIAVSKETWLLSVGYFYDSEGNFINQLLLEIYKD